LNKPIAVKKLLHQTLYVLLNTGTLALVLKFLIVEDGFGEFRGGNSDRIAFGF
jgi:hypothetical protein